MTATGLAGTGVAHAAPPEAVTYYVDSAAGNDSADGITTSTAWKSLALTTHNRG